MKIIIVGAGISGLSTYLFLQKHLPDPSRHSITIYEAYDVDNSNNRPNQAGAGAEAEEPETDDTSAPAVFAPTAIGNGLGLAANGLNVLRRLDTSLFDEVMRRGHPVTKWEISCARGWRLADFNLVLPKDDRNRDQKTQ